MLVYHHWLYILVSLPCYTIGPGRCSRLLHNNTLNEILVFDLSLATGLYALTNYVGTVMGTRRRGISRSLRDVSD